MIYRGRALRAGAGHAPRDPELHQPRLRPGVAPPRTWPTSSTARISRTSPRELISEPEDLLDSSDEGAPIIRLVNSLLQQAVKERASDIHIEPQEKDLVVRFRVDNILHEPIRALPRRMQQAITTRIKIMGRLDIAEKRLPQDGRIVLKIAGRDYDVRLSTLPTQYGERCVLRLLPRTQELLSIEKIGLSTRHQETLRKLIRRNNGIILVTGPTGSGKTNTLYAALADINKPEHNIMTIEDPVEIRLPGHQPDRGEVVDRAHLRRRAALDPAPEPERDPGRRDPRPGDRRGRDPGQPHRPPGVLDDPHQRVGRHDHAADRHGRRAVPDLVVAGRGDRAAADPRAVQALPRGVHAERRGARRDRAAPRRRRPAHHLPRQGLRALQPHRLPRPHGDLRDPDHRRRDPRR